MLSLGYLLAGAMAKAPEAPAKGAVQESSRIAQVRQSLGIKGIGDAPNVETVKPQQWNALKMGGSPITQMKFL
jgi:hypothetical protein